MVAALERTLHESYEAIQNTTTYIKQLSDLYKQLSNEKYRYVLPYKNEANSLSAIIDQCIGNKKQTSSLDNLTDSDSQRRVPSGMSFTEMTDDSNSIKTGKLSSSSSGSIASGSQQSVDKTSIGSSHHYSNKSPTLLVNSQGADSTLASLTTAPQSKQSTSSSSLGSFKLNRKSHEKSSENLIWNLTIIKSELNSLNQLKSDCQGMFEQMQRISESLQNIFEREHKLRSRSNSNVYRELNSSSARKSAQQQQQQPSSLSTSPIDSNVPNPVETRQAYSASYNLGPPSPQSPSSTLDSVGSGGQQLRGILKKFSPNSVSNTNLASDNLSDYSALMSPYMVASGSNQYNPHNHKQYNYSSHLSDLNKQFAQDDEDGHP